MVAGVSNEDTIRQLDQLTEICKDGELVNSDITGPVRVLVEKQARQIGEAHGHMLRLRVETSGIDLQKND